MCRELQEANVIKLLLNIKWLKDRPNWQSRYCAVRGCAYIAARRRVDVSRGMCHKPP